MRQRMYIRMETAQEEQTQTEIHTATNEDSPDEISKTDSSCTQAFIKQATRFCSPHTAVPEEWAEGKRSPLLYGPYGLSSFTYTILGIYLIAAIPFNNMTVLGTPPIVDGSILIIQGIVSYGCDVYTFGFSSIFKIFDRCSALIQGLWWTLKLTYVPMTWFEYIIFIGSGIIGVVCKFRGEIAMRKLQWIPFLVWHSLWHLIVPLGLFVWAFIRND